MNVQTTIAPTLVHLTINGIEVSVPKGTTIYIAAKQWGIEIPIFCYQDRMPPFGACRMCLVEVEKMPKLQTACTLEVTEGMVVKTHTEMAVKGREEILEFLLINHPLDCPICDRGGECPLQDQTLKFGPGKSRFFEEKRHFKKPIALGPVLMLDRERCITCARCTRFGEVIAGDHALEFIERGYKTEVGTPDGGPAMSKFIGNTIMICPVGALTSQVYRFRARPWDNDSTNTTCALCPVGCSMILDSRDGEIMRTRSLENRNVNDIWLCDKGWFGYEFADHDDRLKKPMVRRQGTLEIASWEEALFVIATKFNEAKESGKLAAVGGNVLTVEENYLLQLLIRQGGEVNHVDHRMGMPILDLNEEGIAPGMEISIGECEQLSFAILIGVDLTEEFPVIWLRLKQSINRGAKVVFLGHYAPEIASQLHEVILSNPGTEIDALKRILPHVETLAKNGGKGALFVGRQYLANPKRLAIMQELQKWQQSVPNVTLNIMEGRGNSMGARFAGMHPQLGPLGEKMMQPGLSAIEVIETSATSGWDFFYVVGADPASQFPTKLWLKARSKLGFLVVQDLFLTETAKQADVVLPTLSFVEKRGSFINIEGRIQQLQPGKLIPEDLYADGEIFTLLAEKLNVTLAVDMNFLEMLKMERIPLERTHIGTATLSPTMDVMPQEGMLLATFAPALFDHGIRMKHNKKLVQLAKEPYAYLSIYEAFKRNIQNNDWVSLRAKNGTISAKIKVDDKVPDGSVLLPLGFEEIPVRELDVNLLNGLPVEVIKKTFKDVNHVS